MDIRKSCHIGFYIEIEFDDEDQEGCDSIAVIAENIADALMEKARGSGLADEDRNGVTLGVDIYHPKLIRIHKHI
jgi:hypothetical protein